MSFALKLENVSKAYRIGSDRERILDVITLSNRFIRRENLDQANILWALKDIQFEVKPGEVVGIIGHNGAGKTTILKLLSRVIRPTKGRVIVNGRASALIELGAGFHPDLTGRENIYLNGVILGLTRKEIDRRFAQIVDFSELNEFIDTPVKRYSSGMYARLGFAVAAHSTPDLLLVDEVLAVGDATFQKKCYDFIHNFVQEGNTAVFVTHNLYVIEQLCERVVWLNKGCIAGIGRPTEILTRYYDHLENQQLHQSIEFSESSADFKVLQVNLLDSEGNKTDTFVPGQDILIEIHYHAKERIQAPKFVVAVLNPEGGMPLISASMLVDNQAPESIFGMGKITCRFISPPFAPKVYQVWGEIWGEDNAKVILKWQQLSIFRMVSDHTYASKGSFRHVRADAPIRVPYQWISE